MVKKFDLTVGNNNLLVEHDISNRSQYLFSTGGNNKAVFQSGLFQYKNPITYKENYRYICNSEPGTNITIQINSSTPFKAYSQILNSNVFVLRSGPGYNGSNDIPATLSGDDTGFDPTDPNAVSSVLNVSYEALELFNSSSRISDLVNGFLFLPDGRSIRVHFEANYVAELVPLEIIVLERNSCRRPTKLTTNSHSLVAWTFNGQLIGKSEIITVPKGQNGNITALNSISANGDRFHPLQSAK